MMNEAKAVVQSNNFNLKNVSVELVRTGHRSERTFMSIEALENLRTERSVIPASKYRLETICGASCETGAQ